MTRSATHEITIHPMTTNEPTITSTAISHPMGRNPPVGHVEDNILDNVPFYFRIVHEMRVSASIPVYVDDRLSHRTGPATTMRATVVKDDSFRRIVDAKLRKVDMATVLPDIDVPSSGLMGLLGRKKVVSVNLVESRSKWDKRGVLRVEFVWDIDAPSIDIANVKHGVGGGITDGWGEVNEQICRFGTLCVLGDDDKWRIAKGSERKGLSASDNGRYAVLLTLVGAKFVVKR